MYTNQGKARQVEVGVDSSSSWSTNMFIIKIATGDNTQAKRILNLSRWLQGVWCEKEEEKSLHDEFSRCETERQGEGVASLVSKNETTNGQISREFRFKSDLDENAKGRNLKGRRSSDIWFDARFKWSNIFLRLFFSVALIRSVNVEKSNQPLPMEFDTFVIKTCVQKWLLCKTTRLLVCSSFFRTFKFCVIIIWRNKECLLESTFQGKLVLTFTNSCRGTNTISDFITLGFQQPVLLSFPILSLSTSLSISLFHFFTHKHAANVLDQFDD